MKKLKKTISILLALVMVLGLVIPAFAEETTTEPTTPPATTTPIAAPNKTTATITVNNESNHTYAVYQIFAGDTESEKSPSILSNVVWGANAKLPEGQNVGAPVPQSILDELAASHTGTGADAEYLTVLKKYVDLTTNPVGYV